MVPQQPKTDKILQQLRDRLSSALFKIKPNLHSTFAELQIHQTLSAPAMMVLGFHFLHFLFEISATLFPLCKRFLKY